MTIPGLFADAARPDPARPCLTYYDDDTHERTELSYITMDNWVSKTANLLIDDAGLTEDDVVGINMPTHWLTAVTMLATWRAGFGITHRTTDGDANFISEDDLADAENGDTVYAISLAPLAVGLRNADAKKAAAEVNVTDFLTEVRSHGDHFQPRQIVTDGFPALIGLTDGSSRSHGELVAAAHQRADELGIVAGERVLLAGANLRPLDWLLAPLAKGAGVVLCRNEGDHAKRAESERARVIDCTRLEERRSPVYR